MPRYQDPARSLEELVIARGRAALWCCTWRQGSRGSLRSRFVVMAVRPAGVAATKAARVRAGGSRAWDGVLPPETLIAEWPPHHEAPTDYWLPVCPRTPCCGPWCVWPRSGGGSSTTTASSSTVWGWTTTRGGPGGAGTTTSRWSARRMRSSPCAGSTQNRRRRSEFLPGPPSIAGGVAVLDRRVPHLSSTTRTAAPPGHELTKYY